MTGSTALKKNFIGCVNWKAGEKYQYLSIPNNIDLELLEAMFNENSYNNDFEVKFNHGHIRRQNGF